MMQEIDFYLVDAFSDRAFGGNAAAVCPLEAWLSDETLLKMAKQHNQSETAFLSERITGLSCAGLPRRMKLTSAATQPSRLLTLFLNTDYPHTEITFTTRFVGELTVQRSGDWLTLNFPAWSTGVVDTPPQCCSARWALTRQTRCVWGVTTWWCSTASGRWRR